MSLKGERVSKSPYWEFKFPIISHPESTILTSYHFRRSCSKVPFCFCCFKISVPSWFTPLLLIKSCGLKLVFQLPENYLVLSLFTLENCWLNHLLKIIGTSNVKVVNWPSLRSNPDFPCTVLLFCIGMHLETFVGVNGGNQRSRGKKWKTYNEIWVPKVTAFLWSTLYNFSNRSVGLQKGWVWLQSWKFCVCLYQLVHVCSLTFTCTCFRLVWKGKRFINLIFK